MSGKLVIFVVIIDTLFLVYILWKIKNNKLNIKNALIWIILGLIILVCTFSMPILQNLAVFLGIEVVSNMLFFILLMFLVFVCFTITISLSVIQQRIIKLTQEIGLLNEKVRSYENRTDE